MPLLWARPDRNAVILSVHVQPGASRSEAAGEYGDSLKIRLAAPPVDGKANAALIRFVATALDVPRSQVELIGGAASRQKRLRVSGKSLDAIEAAFRTGTDRLPARQREPTDTPSSSSGSPGAHPRPQ